MMLPLSRFDCCHFTLYSVFIKFIIFFGQIDFWKHARISHSEIEANLSLCVVVGGVSKWPFIKWNSPKKSILDILRGDRGSFSRFSLHSCKFERRRKSNGVFAIPFTAWDCVWYCEKCDERYTLYCRLFFWTTFQAPESHTLMHKTILFQRIERYHCHRNIC